MEIDGYFRTTIGAMISQGLAVDAVREGLFLEAASEVWGGPGMDAHPAWYFWLGKSAGAYRLQLVQSGWQDFEDGGIARGVFSVKYYPSPLEPVFTEFSRREQVLRQGGAFDNTMTPKFDAMVPENLFSVGTIEFFRDFSSAQSFLAFTSLEQLRFYESGAGIDGGDERNPSFSIMSAQPRNLPAWSLGYPLFDAIVSLHAFLMRESPKRVLLSHQTGFDVVENEAGFLTQRDTDESSFKSLLVAFSPERGDSASRFEGFITSQLLQSPWTPMIDTATSCESALNSHKHSCHCRTGAANSASDSACGGSNDHHSTTDRALCRNTSVDEVTRQIPPYLNEQWWRMAKTEQFVKSMCGCH